MVKRSVLLLVGLALCLGLAPQVSAQPVAFTSPGGIGDLGLGPLYDVRATGARTDKWENYLVFENTTGRWVAFHLRFRAWRKSIEVYDHIILLSPYDVFWCVLRRALASDAGKVTSNGLLIEAGDVMITSADTETLLNSGMVYPEDVDANGNTFWLEKFQDFLLADCGFTAAAGYDQKAEMQAGHLEAIGLWSLLPESWASKIAYDGCCDCCCDEGCTVWAENKTDTSDLKNVVRDLYSDGSSGNINVYDVLEALFWEKGPNGVANYPGWACSLVRISGKGTPTQDTDNETGLDGVARWGMDFGNVLAGTMEMYDTGNGMYSLENLIFLENFRTDLGWTQWHEKYVYCGDGRTSCFYLGGSGAHCGYEGWYWGNEIGHRDGYAGGAIVYPTDVMRWYYPDYYDGKYRHPWWYVNENWATTVGPGLRDGNDWNIENNDPNIPDFNNNWSLWWVEAALAKSEIWYQWFDLVTFDGADVTTDVVLTYPTKHYHWFFSDWPYYNGQQGDDNTSGKGYSCCYGYSQLPPFTYCDYEHNGYSCLDYPPGTDYTGSKSWGAYWTCTGGWAKGNVFTSVSAYWGAVDAYRGVDADINCSGSKNGSIAVYFLSKYKNGPIYSTPTMWDMDEHLKPGEPSEPPPGSPWRPEITITSYIPHEVNIVRVGETSGTGINEANWLLSGGAAAGFTSGQFRLTRMTVNNSDRKYWWRDDCASYGGECGDNCIENTKYPYCTWKSEAWNWIPPIGLVYFTHTYGSDVDGITRSAAAEWHYKHGYYDFGFLNVIFSATDK